MADLKTTNIFGDAYINNKVGIATNAPATRLQIGQLSPTAATEGLQFGDDTGARLYRGGSSYIQASAGFQAGAQIYASTYLQSGNSQMYPGSYTSTQRFGIGNASGNAWIDGLTIAQGGNVTVYNNLTVNGTLSAAGGSSFGTSFPQLTINGTTNTHTYLVINRTNYEGGIQFQTSGTVKWYNYMASGDDANIRWYANSATQMVLSNAGDLTATRYVSGTYVNTSDDVSTSNITYIMAKFGDNYHRSATAAKVAAFISGQTMNIVGTAASETLGTVSGRGNNTSTQLIVSTAAGQAMYVGRQIGAGYSYGSAGIFTAISDNPNGASNIFFQGYNSGSSNTPGGVLAISIRADGQIYTTMNTATGVANNSFSVGKTVVGTIHIANGSGTSGNNRQAAITFQGDVASEAQAGIYVSNNNSTGTAMAFATTDNYATGPQIFMSATNAGVVNFSRARPTYAGNTILDTSYSGTVSGLSIGGNAATVTNGLYTNSTLTAGNLSGTIPSGVLGNSTVYIGTTGITLNRTSSALSLTGISIDGNSGGIYAAGNAYIQTTTTGTAYTSHIQVREAVGGGSNTNEIYAPALGFHWSGVVASNILMESSGRIAIRNNPGSGYENFIASEVFAASTGIGAYNLMKYGGTRSGDWQLFTTSSVGAGQMNVIQVENIGGGGHTNYPTGVYTYGGVMSWRLPNHSFQLYAAHTGDLAYKTQWNNDNYSGWRRILDSSSYPYAANMNQYVRTTDSPTFAAVSATTFTGALTGTASGNLTAASTLTAGNLSGTIPSGVLGNSTLYVGTTAITLNRTSSALSLTGISIDGNAATATTLQTARAINGVSFNGSAAITVDGLNYSVNNAWLRENGDDAQFQMYGNSRTMIYRTDGNTNPHGGGAFAHIFYYGGSADANRMFIINTDGRLWSTYHGWLDTMSTTGNAANVSISNLNTQQVSISLAAGAWYTIAANDSNRASAKFTITDTTSGLHQAIHFYATAHYGTDSGAKLSVVSNTYYGGPPVSAIRIMRGSTYDGAMVQIYALSACNLTVSIYDNQQSSGWVIKSGVVSTTNPGTVATFASLTTVAASADLTAAKSFTVSDDLYIGGATTQYKALHANNYNSYSPTLTGTGASGTWGISVTGNASTATTTDNINGRAFYNRDSGNALAQDSYTNNGIGYVNSVSLFGQTDGGMYASAYSTSWIHQIYGDFRTGQIAIRGKNSGTWQSWRTVLDATNSPYAYNMNQYVRTTDTCSFAAVTATTFTGALSGNATTATTATGLNSSNYIARCGSSGNYNTDFQNTPAGTVRHLGDDANATNNPGNTWWFVDNYRHSNGSNYWGTQVAWGWEDNANRLATRNVTGGSFGSWVYYLNSGNYNSYSPTLTGTGASGTWGISISGNAATATSATSATTATTATNATVNSGNTSGAWYPIVWHSGNTLYSTAGVTLYAGGSYIQTSYFNCSDDVSTGNITYIMAKFGDNYLRSATAAKVAAFITGQTMNINGSSTSCSGNAATCTTANAVASAAVKAAGLDSSVEFTMTGLTSNSTIKIFPSYVSPYSSFLRMGYDNTGNYEYTIKRDGTTGFLEFYNTQANYTGYYFRINGSGGGLGIAVSPASRLHVNGDGTNPAVRVDNTGVVLAASVGSNGRTFYGWLPISVDGTTRWIRIFS